MNIRSRVVAALTAGAALLAIPAAAAPANATTYVGTLHRGWTTGVPAAVHRGQTITIELWFKQTSPYDLYTDMDAVWLASPGHGVGQKPSAVGATVTWLNPRTHQWIPSTWDGSHGAYQELLIPGGEIKVPSGVWSHIYARITFSRTAQLGTWTFEAVAPASYYLLTKAGKGTSVTIRDSGLRVRSLRLVR